MPDLNVMTFPVTNPSNELVALNDASVIDFGSRPWIAAMSNDFAMILEKPSANRE